MKQVIEVTIRETILQSGLLYYREPLISYADANDPIFLELKKVVGSEHLLPQDLLAGARSVLAFFLPFKREVIINNRIGPLASREWAEVYIHTNQLIDHIVVTLKATLAKQGVCLESQPRLIFLIR